MQPDVYEMAVDYLTAHPGEISEAWLEGACEIDPHHPAWCLFRYVDDCGCLTMIRGYKGRASDLYKGKGKGLSKLAKLVRADTRIPSSCDHITIDHLPIFAGWMRRIDIALNRTPPAPHPELVKWWNEHRRDSLSEITVLHGADMKAADTADPSDTPVDAGEPQSLSFSSGSGARSRAPEPCTEGSKGAASQAPARGTARGSTPSGVQTCVVARPPRASDVSHATANAETRD